jgi:uncharacterized glyoxalase superfamily protein PhnB
MPQDARNALPDIIPALRYRDAPAAIEWLAKAFGFEKRFIVPGPDGGIAHAELRLGNGLVMLGSVRDDDFHWAPPRKGEVVTQSVYVVVVDADAHHERAKSAGAEIVRELQDTDYGSREYRPRSRRPSLAFRHLPAGQNGLKAHALEWLLASAARSGALTSRLALPPSGLAALGPTYARDVGSG